MAGILLGIHSAFDGIANINLKTRPICVRDHLLTSTVRGTQLRVYVDASYLRDGRSSVGIVFLLRVSGQDVVALISESFPPGRFANNNDVELYGIALATELALNDGFDQISIISDSASGIRRCENAARSAQHMRDLTDNTPSDLTLLMDRILTSGVEVQFLHTYGHNRDTGNLIADLLTKEAMQTDRRTHQILNMGQLRIWIEMKFRDILEGSRNPEIQRQLNQW